MKEEGQRSRATVISIVLSITLPVMLVLAIAFTFMLMPAFGLADAAQTVEATAQPVAQATAVPAATPTYRELKRGDSGVDVQQLMQRLYDLGYYTSSVDDKYGPGMARAVKLFNLQSGFGAGENASVDMQIAVFASDAQRMATLPPQLTAVHLEQYEGTPVFSVDVYNPQERAITFISVIYRCFDAAGNEIFASTAPGGEARFGKYREISIGSGQNQDMRRSAAFDLSAYPNVARVDAALYCYESGSNVIIIPEKLFAWASSNGTVARSTTEQSVLQQYNRTNDQDKLAGRFTLGAESAYIYSFEAQHYGLPNGLYIKSVEAGGVAATTGLQPGDVITSIAGVPLDCDEMLYIIKSMMNPNTDYDIKYVRGGAELSGIIRWNQ